MNYLLYIILVVSIIFQDLQLKESFGYLGQSLTSIITPIILFIMIINKQISKTKININKYTVFLIKIFVYMIVVSVLSLMIYIFYLNGDVVFWQQNIFIKGIKASIYFLDIILFLIIIENLQTEITVKQMFRPIIMVYCMLLILLIFELRDPALFSYIFHDGEISNRVRLTTPESSFTGSLITVFFVLTFYYFQKINKNVFFKYISLLLYFIFILYSGSKGFLLVIPIILLFLFLKSLNIKTKKNIIFIFVFIILIFVFIKLFSPIVLKSINYDITSYSSVVTRGYTTYCAFKIAINYPFGIGTSIYPIIYTNYLSDNLSILNNFSMTFNLSEINSLIYSINGENVAAKVPIAQYSMYWGIIGTIAFIYFYWIQIYRKTSAIKNSYILQYGFLFIFISIISYNTFENKYEIWFFIITILNIQSIISKCNVENGNR